MPEHEKKQSILIVEDEHLMSKAIEIKLSQADFTTKVAQNGEEAITILGTESFDCIILDLIMPKMDGFEVLKKIKEQGIVTPVIVLTNLSMDEDEKRARELGADEFLVKTDIPIAEIAEKVKNMIRQGAKAHE